MSVFAGKSVIVTGAASGIGRALVQALVAQGAVVYAADCNDQGLQQLKVQLHQQYDHRCQLVPVVLDVTNELAVEKLLQRVVTETRVLDYMFNNAGIVASGPFEQMDTRTCQRIVAINLWGVIHGTRHAYAIMRRQGHGHIINTASTAGVTPVARSVPYAATKHAVVGLSTSLREEAREHNIRISVVLPGLVDTGIFSSAMTTTGYDYVGQIQRMPLRKISADMAAEEILYGVVRNNMFIVFPAYNRILVTLYRLMPTCIGRLINRMT